LREKWKRENKMRSSTPSPARQERVRRGTQAWREMRRMQGVEDEGREREGQSEGEEEEEMVSYRESEEEMLVLIEKGEMLR